MERRRKDPNPVRNPNTFPIDTSSSSDASSHASDLISFEVPPAGVTTRRGVRPVVIREARLTPGVPSLAWDSQHDWTLPVGHVKRTRSLLENSANGPTPKRNRASDSMRNYGRPATYGRPTAPTVHDLTTSMSRLRSFVAPSSEEDEADNEWEGEGSPNWRQVTTSAQNAVLNVTAQAGNINTSTVGPQVPRFPEQLLRQITKPEIPVKPVSK